MCPKKGEYQQKLEEYFFPEIQTHATNVLIAGGLGLLGDRFAGPMTGTAIGVVVFCLSTVAGEFLPAGIIEHWRVGDLERYATLKLQDLTEMVSNRRILTSLAVEPNEAEQLVGTLPVL